MQSTKKLILTVVSMLLLGTHESSSAAPMSGLSTLKVSTGTVVSGALGASLAALVTHYCQVGGEVNVGNGPFSLNLQNWNLNRTLICSVASIVSALVGGAVSFGFFTPEGKLSRATSAVNSIDHDLLQSIETSGTIEEFSKKIQFHYTSSSFPTMAALEYLQSKHLELISAKELLEELLNKVDNFPQLKNEIMDARNSLEKLIPTVEKGVAIIRADPSFDTKMQAYILEKQLQDIKSELSRIKMNTNRYR